MATPVIMPRQGQSVESCIIGKWHKKKGDSVASGDTLFTYETDKATNGREGLEKIESGGYDLVILDIMLPELNGIEVLRRARRTTDVPVILLTARDCVTDKVSGLDMGANDYITKPIIKARLTSSLDAHLNSLARG